MTARRTVRLTCLEAVLETLIFGQAHLVRQDHAWNQSVIDEHRDAVFSISMLCVMGSSRAGLTGTRAIGHAPGTHAREVPQR